MGKKVISMMAMMLILSLSFLSSTPTTSTYSKPYTNFSISSLNNLENKVVITYKSQGNKMTFSESDIHLKNSPVSIGYLSADQIKELLKKKDILSVELDKQVKTMVQNQDWGIKTTEVPRAWSNGYTGKGVKVAVLDTGIGPHEDIKVSGGISFVPGISSYNDDNGHGTHVAGIISGENNDLGVIGVAPESDVYSVKVLDKNGTGEISNIIKGVDWAITNKMDIINLSVGFLMRSSALETVINKATNSGILVVAAGGNSGSYSGLGSNVTYPAKYPATIAVGAMNQYYLKGDFSSTGSELDVIAPGVNITSTYLNNEYKTLSGTSMAAPFISGQLALLKQQFPQNTNQELRNKLENLAFDLGINGQDPLYGKGLIIYGNQSPNEISLPDKILLSITKSSETIPLKGLMSFTFKTSNESGEPISNSTIFVVVKMPSRMMSTFLVSTDINGLATVKIQGNNGYQTKDVGTYQVNVKAYKLGQVGAMENTSFIVTP